MIVSNHQKNIAYFKEYPCYSATTHLSEHRQLQFGNVTYVEFSRQTISKSQLPKFYIDTYQAPQKMYWLQWSMQSISQSIIEEGRNKAAQVQGQNGVNSSKSFPPSTLQKITSNSRCLYVAQLGKIAHIKLVFNYDPEMVAICQDYIYTVGGNQLIITELWPQIPQTKDTGSAQELPTKPFQTVHQLQLGSKILSLDFVYEGQERALCKMIYFHEKKGIYAQSYKKNQLSENSIINRIFDFSLKFKKNQERPIFYSTLVPNILGITIHNLHEFSLFNLTEMKSIQNTRFSLQGWQLNNHQPIIIKSYQNSVHINYNDCLMISIGQGSNIELFLYHIMYSSKAIISQLNKGQSLPASEQRKRPIHMFSSGQFIDFEKSMLKSFTIINLEQVTYLSNYILTKNGILYLGYSKNSESDQYQVSDELPISGFIEYQTPYITHEILMQQNKIWRQYKFDILLGQNQQQNKDHSLFLQRLLTPGRYEKSFIVKSLKLDKITDLKDDSKPQSAFKEISQKLLLDWRNEYKFVEFVIYKKQLLVIRKNSISTLLPITEQQFAQQKDQLSERQVSYNELLRRGFSVRYDLQGDEYIDEQFDLYHHKHQSDIVPHNCKSYEDKIRMINAKVRNYMEDGWFEDGIVKEENMNAEYYDKQEIQNYSELYEKTMEKINCLARSPTVEKKKQKQKNVSNPIEQAKQSLLTVETVSNQISLYTSILSLRVKDKLNEMINILKVNYQYYFKSLTSQEKRNQHHRVSGQQITVELLQKVHLQHIYVVFVLEWIENVGGKYHLQEQYELFDHDLIEEFVVDYVTKHIKDTEKLSHDIQMRTQNTLPNSSLQDHVDFIFALMFRGLVNEFNHQKKNQILQHTKQPYQFKEQQTMTLELKKINEESNLFVMMLLKRHQQHQSSDEEYTSFITQDLLMCLYKQLLIQPFNQNLSHFIPINKTFVYSILSLPMPKQQKTRILSSQLDRKSFLALLLLIQLQNNCHLTIEEGIEVEIYQNNLSKFEQNTIKLSRQSCCILEEIILINYKLFLFPKPASKKTLLQQSSQRPKSKILQKQQQSEEAVSYQNRSIQFIKSVFPNIDFMYLTSAIMNPKQFQQDSKTDIEPSSNFENKSIAYTYRQLIQQVQEINDNYRQSKGNKIQRTFKRFYSKIYHPRSESTTSKDITYPSIIESEPKLSKWELDVIGKLYERQLKIFKMEKKQTFESTTLVQQRLNLQYAMLKIHIYRVKLALKQLPDLTESDKRQYVEIMRTCIERLREAAISFKLWRGRLTQENEEMTDEELLNTLVQIDQMENSRLWNQQQDDHQDQKNQEPENQPTRDIEKWSILGKPLSSQWLQLIQLTFSQTSIYQRPPRSSSNQMLFTNFGSIDSVLMKMLIVIKHDKLRREQELLKKLFGEEKIQEVIQGNAQLKNLYSGKYENFKERNQRDNTTFGLFSRGSINQNNSNSESNRRTHF